LSAGQNSRQLPHAARTSADTGGKASYYRGSEGNDTVMTDLIPSISAAVDEEGSAPIVIDVEDSSSAMSTAASGEISGLAGKLLETDEGSDGIAGTDAILRPSGLESATLAAPVPRPYQLELLNMAKAENIIAYLETGAGKTLVSALLIRDVLSAMRGRDESKLTVFIVDRVPLVIQQAEYVQSILGKTFKVAIFHGHMGLDSWDENRWESELCDKQALFLTAQVFLNALRHAVLDFRRIALLIFDEAHHATKDHPFNTIMREFYFPILQANSVCTGASRLRMSLPRIFGMSASPVKVKNATETASICQEAINTLQRNLQARVVVVSNRSQESVDANVPKADEFVLRYKSGGLGESCSLAMAVGSGISTYSSGLRPRKSLSTVPESESLAAMLDAVSLELGPFPAGYLAAKSRGTDHFDVDASLITDKALQLLSLLMYECRRWDSLPDVSTTFRCIVFVNRRATAVALAWLINQAFAKCEDRRLNACAVLGIHNHSTEAPAVLRMTHVQQREALGRFVSGKFGIMIATNVVEEGLDVPACGLVVMFSSIMSSKSYIQSRGRARHPASRYVAMVPQCGRDSNLESNNLRLARDGADVMHRLVREIGAHDESVIKAAADRPEIGLPILENGDEPCLRSKTTNARLSPMAATNMLNQYCASLPTDKYYIPDGASGPQYTVVQAGPPRTPYVCTVTLPLASPVKQGVCLVPQASRTQAKRLAAMDAYHELYECGALDEHLFPKDSVKHRHETAAEQTNQFVEARINRASKKASKRVRTILVQQPMELRWKRSSFPATEQVFVYAITPRKALPDVSYMPIVPGKDRYGIITKTPIPQAHLHAVQAPSGRPLFSVSLITSMKLSPEQDDLATRYGIAVHQVSVDKTGPAPGRRESVAAFANECDDFKDVTAMQPGFHLVPLVNESSSIDWNAMQILADYDGFRWEEMSGIASFDPKTLENCLVQSRHDKKYVVYFSGRLDTTRSVSSLCNDFIGNKEYVTFLDYYEGRHGCRVRDPSQSLLEGFSRQEIGTPVGRKPFYLVPELCRTVPLSPWAIYYAGLLPFWQTYLAIASFRDGLKHVPDKISFSDFATALQPKRSQEHSLGYDYERLEFIGDAVLKVLASSAVYQIQPLADEGILTESRDALVSNTYLCDVAITLGIYDVIALTGSAVKPKSWPWHMAAPQVVPFTMSEKMLADCVESLIGLCFVHGGLECAALLLDEFGIAKGMPQLIGRPFVQPARRRGDSAADPRLASPLLTEVEEIIGYTFRRKAVLVEALTHASYIQSHVPSYQRLEFLGDAIIGLVIVNDFYEKHKHLQPSHLTFLKEPALSNDMFGRVAAEHGLHNYLWHTSSILDDDMAKVVAAIAKEKDGEDVCDSTFVPKVLGDIIESIVGAIVVDQDMRLDGLDTIVMSLVGTALDRFANPETLEVHPVAALNQMIQTKYQQGPEFTYTVIIATDAQEADDMAASGLCRLGDAHGRYSNGDELTTLGIDDYDNNISCDAVVDNVKIFKFTRCIIKVGDTHIASGTGPCRRKAKRRAASAALEAFSRTQIGIEAAPKRCCVTDLRISTASEDVRA
jgi:endoribonuclease Dicer